MNKANNYEVVMQDLQKQYLIMMKKYLSRLHDAFHKDKASRLIQEQSEASELSFANFVVKKSTYRRNMMHMHQNIRRGLTIE